MPAHPTVSPRAAILLSLGRSAVPDSHLTTELSSLVRGLGYQVIGEVRQRRPETTSALPIGPGKLEELRELIRSAKESGHAQITIACALDLPSGQQRNLEKALDEPVIDRTEIILRIFEARAQTPLAKLEIERARLVHSLPRIRDLEASRRQEGGGGRAAKGHTSTELAKQAAARRIAELGRRIEIIRREQERRMQRRRDLPRVALLGYTNVGKSSWMEQLTAKSASVKDELFHTLGTSIHALRGPGRRILVADTVGFLEALPHTLVESFRSTLAEALDADLRLHVADASNSRLESELAVTRELLTRVDCPPASELLVLNKVDKLTPQEAQELAERYPDALLVSSRSEEDRRRLIEKIRTLIDQECPPRSGTGGTFSPDETSPPEAVTVSALSGATRAAGSATSTGGSRTGAATSTASSPRARPSRRTATNSLEATLSAGGFAHPSLADRVRGIAREPDLFGLFL